MYIMEVPIRTRSDKLSHLCILLLCPSPGDVAAKLLEEANVHLPRVLPHLGATVVSKKTLQSHAGPIDFDWYSDSQVSSLYAGRSASRESMLDTARGELVEP